VPEEMRRRGVHTEHILFECSVGPDNADGVQLFRAPTVLDGSGTHQRLPHSITWEDMRSGDRIVAIRFVDLGNGVRVIDILQFWHVLEKGEGGDTFRVEINNIVGGGGDGEFVYDRIAGLLGLPPGERRQG
jgi:hypothetical protein